NTSPRPFPQSGRAGRAGVHYLLNLFKFINIILCSEHWSSICKSSIGTRKIDGAGVRLELSQSSCVINTVGARAHSDEAGLRCPHVSPWSRRSGIIDNSDWYNRQLQSPV